MQTKAHETRLPDVKLAPAAFEWALMCELLPVSASAIAVRRADALAVGRLQQRSERLGGSRIPDPAGAARQRPSHRGGVVGQVSVAARRAVIATGEIRPVVDRLSRGLSGHARSLSKTCVLSCDAGFWSPICALACGRPYGATCATSARRDSYPATRWRYGAITARSNLSPPLQRVRKRLRRSAIRRTHGDHPAMIDRQR